MKRLLAAAALFLGLTSTLHAAALDEVKARGTLNCGVNPNLQGFAAKGEYGNWAGFHVDFCKALAGGQIDVPARNTTWTIKRETKLKLRFPGISYHDGQGFIVKKPLGVTSALNLSGAAISFQTGTTSEANVEDVFREKEVVFQPISLERLDKLIKAFDGGQCDTMTTDVSFLYAVRLRLTEPGGAMVLQDVISKDPLGPAIRQGDEQWFNIVRWTVLALINAEELGGTATSIGEFKSTFRYADIRRLLGAERGMGLDPDWATHAIKAVGYYGDIFERNLGEQTPLQISRGINAMWNQGGLLYTPPVR